MKGWLKHFLLLSFCLNAGFNSDLVWGNDAAHYQDGKAFAQELQPLSPSQGDLNKVPGYAGDSPAQTNYYENSHLLAKEATALTMQSSEEAEASGEARAIAGSFVRETEATRARFDLRGDPIIVEGDQIVADPLKVLKATATNLPAGEIVSDSTHTCEESKEEEELGCIQRRIIKVKEPAPKTWRLEVSLYNNRQGGERGVDIITGQLLDGWRSDKGTAVTVPGGGYSSYLKVINPLPAALHDRLIDIKQDISIETTQVNGLQRRFVKLSGRQLRVWCPAYSLFATRYGAFAWWVRATVYIDVVYTPLATEEDIIESIEDGCPALEARADRGECRYGSIETLEGAGEREVSNGRDTIKVHRDWWKRRLTYICRYPSQNNCDPYRAQGCEQVKSECKTFKAGRCLEYRQTFRCQKRRLNNGQVTIAGEGVPFCLDGNCDDHSWAANQDFAEAMAKLSVFKEMGKDMDATNATAFKGDGKQCSKAIVGFKDCCQNSGWGRKVGLTQDCTEGEKHLAKLRSQNLCVYVGTYCAEREKVTKICLRKKSSFCCFGTKLARILHEQGRRQLALDFGCAESPNCRPFTVNELQRLDFNKINFAELYAEIQAKAQVQTIAGTAQRLGQDWGAKVSSPRFDIEAEKQKRLKKIHDQKQNPQKEPGEQSDVVM
jgi:conjugal transfer mating pair stabilization protein TraN